MVRRLFVGTTILAGLSLPLFLLAPITQAAGLPATPTYTPGELVRFQHSPSVFLVDPVPFGSSGPLTLHWIPNESVFQSMGGSWSQVQVLPSTVGRPPISQSVSLFRVKGSPTIYELVGTSVHAYPQPSYYGPSGPPNSGPEYIPPANKAYTVPTIADLPGKITPWPSDGTYLAMTRTVYGLNQVPGQTPVYWFNGTSYHWIPNSQIFNDSGFQWSNVHEVTTIAHAPIGSPMMLFRQQGHTQVYLLSQGQLHWIPSAADFTSLDYRWNEVWTVNELPAPIGFPA